MSMERIEWVDSVSKEEILERLKETETLLKTLKRRKNNWIRTIKLLWTTQLEDTMGGGKDKD